MRRAAVSVPSNIAEGQSRLTTAEYKHFVGIARGSLAELNTQVKLSVVLGYVQSEDAAASLELIAEAGRLTNGLLRALEKRSAAAR